MNENVKVNERCIKGNTAYFKIKINDMIKYEIEKIGVDSELYQKFNCQISDNFSEFSNKMILEGDFNSAITNLRDKIIADCIETDKNSSLKMRHFFKDYIFDKVYTMGINIKKGILPEDYEQQLEQERLNMEEENKLKEEIEEKEKNTNEINITVENEIEEKDPDIVDQMWNYFFGPSKSNISKKEKKSEKKEKEENEIVEE